jgi:hypothetical protein
LNADRAATNKRFHHKDREEHEVQKFDIPIFEPFVVFVCFVVTGDFLHCSLATVYCLLDKR